MGWLSIALCCVHPPRNKKNCLQLDIALWCNNQIEHSIWDESLLFSNCARSLEYSSSSTLAGLSYHICGKLEVAFKGSPSSQHQHCTDEAQKAEKSLQLTRIFVECLPEDLHRQAFLDCGEILSSSFYISFCCPSGLLFNFFGGVLFSPLLGLSLQLCLVV